MEAASRPPLEPLADLPVEEPLDGAAAQPKAPSPPAAAPPAAAKDPAQTGITFLDPASLVLEGAESTAAPEVPAAAPAKPAAEELELVLEDPAVVEELLTTPPPPPPKPAAFISEPAPTLTPAAPQSSAAASPGTKPEPRPEVRVPIIKTASLSAAASKVAATKLAAATKRAETAPRATIPTVPPAKAVPAAAAAAKPVRPPAPATAPAAAAPPGDGLAGWTSARAAAAAPAAKPKAPGPAAAPATKPAAAKPAPSAEPAAAATPATMDRDYIARNQIVERYLSGRLPLKGATDFEQFVARHPEILDEIGLPERVNAGLRLLEASGKPEPWQEPARPAWQKPQVTLALAVLVALMGVALLVMTGATTSKNHRIAQLQKQVADQPLDPATSTREIRVMPSREGASNSPAITIGGGGAQLADFKIDESRSPYHVFRVTIDRIDQGRVAIISNLEKDSNGHLRIALNSTALGPGNYQLTIEGLNWRGDPEPDSWVTIGIAR